MASFSHLGSQLTDRKQQHLYRHRRQLQSAQSVSVRMDGKQYLAFTSNDYLGLANHPDVVAAFKQAADQYGVGSGASHLVSGHSVLHHQLEEALAEFTGRPRALLFSSGYMANIGAVNAILSKTDAVFEDKLNHASLLDAGLLSGARFQRYQHNNIDDLSSRLEKNKAENKLIISDGVFSMDGDQAPIDDLIAVAKQHQAWLMIDDAHGFGVVGDRGQGVAGDKSCEDVAILVGTLGKSFGTAGAFVAGSEELIETLIQYARTYIYTTAIPPAVAAASLKSLEIINNENWRREHLTALIKQFRLGAEQLGFELLDSSTPIQPILVGESDKALQLSEFLKQQGILISAIRPPTVANGSARLRVTFSAEHSEEQVDQLLAALELAQGGTT